MDNRNNFCVIMAGGIGSRFWPFSRESKPKQFLDFFGTGRSLLQMTVDRFRPIVPIENMVIVTNVAYKDLILEQVPDMQESQILCEPARRNTAPCIAYATAWIKERLRVTGYGLPVTDEPYDGIILNAGGYSHTSVALRDAVEESEVPVVEVHISDIRTREPFRQLSLLTDVCAYSIIGKGTDGYKEAVEHILSLAGC